jgi:hypothetical protein
MGDTIDRFDSSTTMIDTSHGEVSNASHDVIAAEQPRR